MNRLACRSLFAGLAAFVGALLLLGIVATLRLWPRIAGQHLPLSLIWPFARPLLAAGLELAFLVSVPSALGLAASGAGARVPGGASLPATAFATCSLLFVLGAFSFGVSSWLDGRGSSPGELATELVASARESCIESAPPAEVSVPLLGFAWVCEAGRAPQLRGHAPIGKQASFQAAAIALGDDLKRIALDRFTLAFPLPTLQVRVRASHATLSGLPPWGRSRRMPIGLRIALFASSAGLAAFGVARMASRRPWLPAWAGALLGAGASGALWWAASWMERQELRGPAYLILPGAAVLAVGLCAACLLVAARVRRWRAGSSQGSAAT